jgi:hypothetical protein
MSASTPLSARPAWPFRAANVAPPYEPPAPPVPLIVRDPATFQFERVGGHLWIVGYGRLRLDPASLRVLAGMMLQVADDIEADTPKDPAGE